MAADWSECQDWGSTVIDTHRHRGIYTLKKRTVTLSKEKFLTASSYEVSAVALTR